ncbi:DNA mismatch repair endonuclease MutL [Candidatus Saganbacteria bacterium]|nr:DNA mismatch repair endonuclease MutL [Candidatus Saganbacteria bacterium]
MPKIQILPNDLIDKIAAGEVVERPASVVKELVENSIDAGSRHISIEVKGAGKKLIQVADDGQGMAEDEIQLALLRHSTSKISSLDDLFNIRTLGFRGEALPSIASVSKMKIERNSSGRGVTVTVADLFQNIPARLKFLKSDITEVGHITDLVSRFILSHPEIAFKLMIDDREIFSSPGSGKLEDAALTVYGLDLTKNLLPVKNEMVTGLVSRPNISRVDRNMESFFVNGRYVKNFLLGRAVEDAYRTLIPSSRYPVAVIFLSVPPAEVDVNVHPTKREVKFLKTQQVTGAVYQAVKQALANALEVKGYQSSGVSEREDQEIRISEGTERKAEQYEEVELVVSEVQPLIPVQQFKDTYIITTDGVDLILVDQHAAHERILFDRLQSRPAGETHSQSLLIPENIKFTREEALHLKNQLSFLSGLGFEIEEFGGNSFLIRSVPQVLTKVAPREVLSDILAELSDKTLEDKQAAILKLMACHAAVKAGDRLSSDEMNGLLRDLYKTANPLTCPHGRPTMVKLTVAELEKMFGRRK